MHYLLVEEMAKPLPRKETALNMERFCIIYPDYDHLATGPEAQYRLHAIQKDIKICEKIRKSLVQIPSVISVMETYTCFLMPGCQSTSEN